MATADEGTQGVQHWKNKYFDSLEDLEKKEKQWSGVEDLLRRTISRLTLAAEGLDDTLDRQLKELRDAIRDRDEGPTLSRKIESMSNTLVQLEKERSAKQSAPPAAHLLLQLLDQLQFPREANREAKGIRKAIAAATAETPTAPLIKPLAALISDSLQQASTGKSANTSREPSSGLLNRIFGGNKEGARQDSGKATPPKEAAITDTEDHQEALEMARELLATLVEQSAPMTHNGKLNLVLRRRALQARHRDELQQLGAELLRELHQVAANDAVQTQEAPQAETQEDIADQTPMAVEEILLQLLEQLHLPVEYTERVESLQERIEDPGPNPDWSALLTEIASLVSDLRSRIQAEKQELEDFLKQLTERLQEVDAHLHGSEAFREASLQSSRDLDAAVKEEVRGIETSVRQASDLQQLKTEVQSHLENIVAQLEDHQREEEASHQQAKDEVASLQARMTELEAETEQLRSRITQEREQAMTDALTGIPNRLAYDDRIRHEVARWKRFNTPLALLVWDVDKFKSVNDNFGHKAGDKVLKTVAKQLHSNIRETDFLARFGGEEFILIMTGTEMPVIQEVADKLRTSVSNCGFHFRDTDVTITISCGIAMFRKEDTPEAVFERADKALYHAKENGRNRCEVADD